MVKEEIRQIYADLCSYKYKLIKQNEDIILYNGNENDTAKIFEFIDYEEADRIYEKYGIFKCQLK